MHLHHTAYLRSCMCLNQVGINLCKLAPLACGLAWLVAIW